MTKQPKKFEFVFRKSYQSEDRNFEKGFTFQSYVNSWVKQNEENGFIEMFSFKPVDEKIPQFDAPCQYVMFATNEVEVKED